MSTTRDFSAPNTKFVELTPELEKKERERNTPVRGGIFSSWNSPIDELDPSLVPSDKRELLMRSNAQHPTPAPSTTHQTPAFGVKLNSKAVEGLVSIPPQAMKQFRQFIKNISNVKIAFSSEEARLFLDVLESMPTPKQMADAKAIIRLSEQVERIISANESHPTA